MLMSLITNNIRMAIVASALALQVCRISSAEASTYYVDASVLQAMGWTCGTGVDYEGISCDDPAATTGADTGGGDALP